MANVEGLGAGRRRLLTSVTNSIVLYRCKVCIDALKIEKYRKQMDSVQRRGSLRFASFCRTVSEPALLVVAGVMPIDLMVEDWRVSTRPGINLGS